MCLSITKNVAATSCFRSTSSSSGVAVGFGPSSNVRYSVGGSVVGIRHTVRSPTSIRNGKGATCARIAVPTPISHHMDLRDYRTAASFLTRSTV